jgi:ceramide glucosyltransferase
MNPLAVPAQCLAVLATLPALVALSYPLHAWLALRRSPKLREGTQRLSVLVPLGGAPRELVENLEGLFAQRLPAGSEILLCVESETDPAARIARAAMIAAGTPKARLIVTGPPGDLLAKIHNLQGGLAKATGAVIVLLDADAHLPHARYLAELTAPLDDPSIGVVTAFPWYVNARRPAAALLAAMLNADLLGTFALRATWGRMRFANGTCMAIRHDALAEAGGLRWLGRRMLVDSALADRVANGGRRVVLHREPVLVQCPVAGTRDVWQQAHRWHLSLRQGLHPLTYAAFGWLRSPLLLAIAAWALDPGAAWGPRLVVGIAASRLCAAVALAILVRTSARSIAPLAAQPLADLVNPFVWAWGALGSSMTWHGRRYRVARGAVLHPIAAEKHSWTWSLERLERFTRARDWAIQLPIIALAATFVACASPAPADGLASVIAWACLVQGLLVCGGYVVNDLTDRAADAAKGAPGWSRRAWSIRQGLACALIPAGIAVAATRGGAAAAVVVLQVAKGLAYSLRPFRLKERGLSGVLAAASLQRLPGVALVWAVRPPHPAAAIACSIWLMALGVAFILEHQLEDFEADHAAGVRTWAQDAGRARVRRVRDASRWVAALAAWGGAITLVMRAESWVGWVAAVGWIVTDLLGFALIGWRYRGDRRVPRTPQRRTCRPDVRIYGAGLAGLSAAVRLARWGMRVEVHEQRLGPGGMAESTPSVHSAQLNPAAIEQRLALRIADAFEPVERERVHWEGRSFDVPPRHVHCLRGALPKALDRRLLDAAIEAGVVVKFGSPLKVGDAFADGPCILATGLARAGGLALARPVDQIHGWVASEPWSGAPELHTFCRRVCGAG